MSKVISYEMDCDDGGRSKRTTLTVTSAFSEKLRRVKNPYTGNKRKLLVPIFTAIEKQGWQYETFLDLFSGSGMVSAAARNLGKKVIANDLSPYAYYNARFLLQDLPTLHAEDIEAITLDYLKPQCFVREYYAERFTDSEALFLDRVKTNIDACLPKDRAVIAYLSVLHYVMDHCFVGGRLNKGQVIAELKHRISHQRNDGKSMSFNDISWVKPFVTGPVGVVLNEDALTVVSSAPECDICYVDPPYGGGQSDYLAMYRFFNEYITGVRDQPDEASKFVSGKTYKQNFEELVDALKNIPKIVFSYNDESWAKVDDIVGAIKRFRKDVAVEKVKYEYNYRDQERSGQEFIILAE